MQSNLDRILRGISVKALLVTCTFLGGSLLSLLLYMAADIKQTAEAGLSATRDIKAVVLVQEEKNKNFDFRLTLLEGKSPKTNTPNINYQLPVK